MAARSTKLFVLVATTLGVFADPATARSASLTRLGLPSGVLETEGHAISADGRTVVGMARTTSGSEAFRWDSVGGMVLLGDLAGGFTSAVALGVSGNGAVVVGQGYGANGYEAFRWTAETGLVGLGDLPNGNFESGAHGVSGDGQTIVGYGRGNGGTEAFRWTEAEGMVGIGDLPGGDAYSVARGVSADGSVIVGFSSSSRSLSNANEMFRWDTVNGMVGRGDIAGGAFDSSGYAVSGDGLVVVGDGTSAVRFPEAVIDGPTTGIVGLGINGALYAASADGSVAVGGSSIHPAFIWDSNHGVRDLKSVLADLGVGVEGWFLGTARGISADGTTIVGYGRTPLGTQEAWIAVIPEPGPGLLVGLGLAGLAWRRRTV